MQPLQLDHVRIGVFGKGGSGKSTLTVFLAGALREAGHPVVVVDADSTNHGLAAALGMSREPRPLLDYFGGMVFGGGLVTCPVDDPTPLSGARLRLDRLDPELVAVNPEGVRLLVAGKLGELGPGAGCDGPVAKIARDVRVMSPDPRLVTLIDFKAGFEDAARGVLTAVDHALAVVDPTTAAIQMARHLARMVSDIQQGHRPATRHLASAELVELAERLYRDARIRGVSCVLNRVRSRGTEAYLRTALDVAVGPVAAAIPEDPVVGDQWLRGERLVSPRLREAAGALACALGSGIVTESSPPAVWSARNEHIEHAG